MKIPEPTNTTAAKIYALHEAKEESPRTYLGWSVIGEKCERKLWLNLRWAISEKFDGRMKRLFETGHREEARVISELRAIGCEVRSIDPSTGQQIAVSAFGGHLRGHVDCLVKGLPESPKKWHLVDVKTCSAKNFAKVQKEGMKVAYPKYWAQAHGYMGELEIEDGMYIFVCKDTDEIYTERFKFEPEVHKANLEKAKRVIFDERIPAPISKDPSWYECSYCAGHDLCHGSRLTKNVSCRTCCHSTPMPDSTWHCAQYDATIPTDAQREGCPEHVIHFDLVPESWRYDHPAWVTPDGRIEGHTSAEIVANPKACALNVKADYAAWGATIVA